MKALAGVLLLLSGCAIEPTSLRVEAAHTSHLLEHMDGSGSHAGYDMVGLDAHWQRGGLYLDLGEYYSPECLDGRHEVFEGRLGFEIPLPR